MSLLLAIFLVVHASIHIGYVCGPAWPFVAADPWPVTLLGAGSGEIRAVGIALVVVTFVAFMVAAPTAVGLLPRRLWAPFIVVASVASAIVLTLFVTPWTVPGLAIDGVFLWATVVQGWRPAPSFGRTGHASPRRQEA
jgi:hypothetical protein